MSRNRARVDRLGETDEQSHGESRGFAMRAGEQARCRMGKLEDHDEKARGAAPGGSNGPSGNFCGRLGSAGDWSVGDATCRDWRAFARDTASRSPRRMRRRWSAGRRTGPGRDFCARATVGRLARAMVQGSGGNEGRHPGGQSGALLISRHISAPGLDRRRPGRGCRRREVEAFVHRSYRLIAPKRLAKLVSEA